MKYVSFVIPSYNSEQYLNKCVDSLLPGGEDVEIIIVNDGSTDNTINIANEYKEKYPNIVRVVDKENGGHGSGINSGIRIAQGIYFKCVDSDDWVDISAYNKLLMTIKENYNKNIIPDAYFTNYVFERLDIKKQYVESFIKDRFPNNQIITWKEAKGFKLSEFLMMHMVMYKLDVIKKSQLELPEKTFYVDSLFVYKPLRFVKTMYYLDVDFYRYYVGRPGQSVQFDNMTKRYKQQLLVTKTMFSYYTLKELKSLPKKQYKFLKHELVIRAYLASFYVYADFNKEKKQAYKEYWKDIKKINKKLYNKIRYNSYFIVSVLLVRPIRIWATKLGYKLVCRKTMWN